MATDFKWYGEGADESIAIRGVSSVAVYLNNHGDVVIRQEGQMGDDDQTVVVPVAFVPSLTAAISKAVADSTVTTEE